MKTTKEKNMAIMCDCCGESRHYYRHAYGLKRLCADCLQAGCSVQHDRELCQFAIAKAKGTS